MSSQVAKNLKREINRLKNYYSGSYRGAFGRTANVRATAHIRNLNRELSALSARIIQNAVRAHQAHVRRAKAHTRNRAPSNLLASAVFSPKRVKKMSNKYGKNWLNNI